MKKTLLEQLVLKLEPFKHANHWTITTAIKTVNIFSNL